MVAQLEVEASEFQFPGFDFAAFQHVIDQGELRFARIAESFG